MNAQIQAAARLVRHDLYHAQTALMEGRDVHAPVTTSDDLRTLAEALDWKSWARVSNALDRFEQIRGRDGRAVENRADAFAVLDAGRVALRYAVEPVGSEARDWPGALSDA